jgi:ribonuclease R
VREDANTMERKKKRTKTKGNKLSARALEREVLKLLLQNPGKHYNPKQVSKKIKADNNADSVAHALEKLAANGKLRSLGDYKYKAIAGEAFQNGRRDRSERRGGENERQVYQGVMDMTRSGAGYVECSGLKNDVYVAPKYMNTAQHGDRVEVRVWYTRGMAKPQGEVLNVLERATEHFLGTIWRYPHHAIVMPDGKATFDILVDNDDVKGALDGDKVVVKIIDWRSARQGAPRGKVTTVLGKAGSHDIEMKSILINNGFNLEFPDEALADAQALKEEISEAEIERRRDFRAVATFTIDPETAKDFDDALSFRMLEDGRREVGVHIADVTHYVQPHTALDKEAYRRSTSVYLVDRVLPMLPEKLSNELCSLRPHEDKLTFSAVFVFNEKDQVVDRWFGKTIIHSDRRFSYEQAQAVLESGQGDFAEELKQLDQLAKKLRARRFRQGSINFETDEVSFRLDEYGAPIDIFVKERKDAHLLIEDFMLLSNREVAAFITKKSKPEEIPFIYRVHDEPDVEKVAELARFAREMGFEMTIGSPREIAKSYNRLVQATRKDPRLKLLEPIAIRTMAKAEYSTDNIGHYGLGFQYYSHFTSPIRRYSDVLAHRLLEKNLAPGAYHRVNKQKLEEQCKHISLQERKAMEAERESVKYKQVEFIEKHVGEVFSGYVSGIIERGLFVELDGSRCEGLVEFHTMDDHYEIMSGNLRVRGRRGGRVIRMGDRARVRILRADLGRRQIDMGWVEE